MRIAFSIRGDKELLRRLEALRGTHTFIRIHGLTMQGARLVAAQAATLAPKDTGRLAKSIQVEPALRAKNPASVVVSMDRGGGSTRKRKKQFVWYGWPVETGHFAGSRRAHKRKLRRAMKEQRKIAIINTGRKFVPAQPFMKPAVERTRPAVLALIERGLNQIMATA